VIEHLPSKQKVLSSNPSAGRKEGRRGEERRGEVKKEKEKKKIHSLTCTKNSIPVCSSVRGVALCELVT
jgi:hypothetical protein